MGSVAFGLSQVGAALEEAKRQRRQEAIEQQYADIAKQYARTNQQRATQEQAEFQERMRVAKLPKFIGFRSVGGRLYYGLQNPDGTVKTNEVTGITSAEDAQSLETEVEALPEGPARDAARATIVPYIQAGDYPGARAALKPIAQTYAKNLLPQPTTTTVTQGEQWQLVDAPTPPGQPQRYVLQSVPVNRTQTTYKGRGAPPQISPPATGTAAPLYRTPPSQMPKAPKSQQLKPEVLSGLNVLHVNLWGSPDAPGLNSTLKVLDSEASRARLIGVGVGSLIDPSAGIVSREVIGKIYSWLTPAELDYAYQFQRAVGSINVLRTIEGMPRSTAALMATYAAELPDPMRTPNSKAAENKLRLIERDIRAALSDTEINKAATAEAGAGAPEIPGPVAPPNTDIPPGVDLDRILDDVVGPVAKPSAGSR